jgi:hypothetical protein
MSQVVRKLCLVGAASLLLAGCGAGRAPVQFNTPEECFQFAQKAAQEKDYIAAVDCLTEDSQEVMAGMMVTAGTMSKAFGGMAAAFGGDSEEAQQMKAGLAKIDAVMTKHGVTEKALEEMGQANPLAGALTGGSDAADQNPEQAIEGVRAMAKPIEDRRTFVADMIGAMEELGNDQAENPVEEFAGELKDVQIDGEEATATILKADAEESPIGFKKTDHGWRIHLDANMLRQQEVSATPSF